MQALTEGNTALLDEDLPGSPRRLRLARRLVFYGTVRALAALIVGLPRSWASGALAGLGWVAWWVRPGDRRTALRQIALAFPSRSPGQRRRLARRSLTVLGRNLGDALRGDAPAVMAPQALERLREHLGGNRPVLFLSGHLGCWELLGPFLVSQGCRLGVITANPHNRWLDAWLRSQRRRRGMTPLDRGQVREAARWLQRGNPLVVLADHRSGGAQIPAPWFGRSAPTPRGPGWLAQRTGARIVPLAVRRRQGGHEILMGEPVEWRADDNPEVLATDCNGALVSLILRAPDEWTWFHDRYGPV